MDYITKKKKINQLDLSKTNSITNTEIRWLELKSALLTIIDNKAPFKLTSITKQRNQTPWVDKELIGIKRNRDFAYAYAAKSKHSNDWFKFKELRDLFQKQSRSKLIDFFARKKTGDFNDSKKVWTFYKNYIKTKSDKQIVPLTAFHSVINS